MGHSAMHEECRTLLHMHSRTCVRGALRDLLAVRSVKGIIPDVIPKDLLLLSLTGPITLQR